MAREFEKALPQRFFGLAFGVDIRRVEEVDAEIKGPVDDPGRLAEIDLGSEGQPRAQGDFADLKAAAAQPACSHDLNASSPRTTCRRRRRATFERFALDSRAVLHLVSKTSADWLPRVQAHLDEVLLDHAHCEKKAAGAAIKLLFSYPHLRFLQEPLAELARDELAHFQQVLAQLNARSIRYQTLRPSPYGMALHALTRREEPNRLLDILLISALIEARSCERFQILADGLAEPALAELYRSLLASEARHHGIYFELAVKLTDRDTVEIRMLELAQLEAEIISEPCDWVRVHAG